MFLFAEMYILLWGLEVQRSCSHQFQHSDLYNDNTVQPWNVITIVKAVHIAVFSFIDNVSQRMVMVYVAVLLLWHEFRLSDWEHNNNVHLNVLVSVLLWRFNVLWCTSWRVNRPWLIISAQKTILEQWCFGISSDYQFVNTPMFTWTFQSWSSGMQVKRWNSPASWIVWANVIKTNKVINSNSIDTLALIYSFYPMHMTWHGGQSYPPRSSQDWWPFSSRLGNLCNKILRWYWFNHSCMYGYVRRILHNNAIIEMRFFLNRVPVIKGIMWSL